MSKPKVLVQLDSDPQASVFDSVVAIDAGVDHLLRHHDVRPDKVRDLVYGAMFTRGPADLHHTAVFIGGSDVAEGEKILSAVKDCFFGPMRVSVMLDSSGANTTAAAAVLAATQHVELKDSKALVLAATGPVGRRVSRLLARSGAEVCVTSRTAAKAQDVCADITTDIPGAKVTWHTTVSPDGLTPALEGVAVILAAGAPGVPLLAADDLAACQALRVAIDLSAVPPAGLEGVDLNDKGTERGGVAFYGALGVGGAKMKIHKSAIRRLFEANDLVLDYEEIYELGQKG